MRRLLLDTHVVLGLLRPALFGQGQPIMRRLAEADVIGFVSVASLWEIAIKTRIGKLEPGMALADIAGFLEAAGLEMLAIEARHAVVAAEPEPATRDPFDRLLLAQCLVEGLELLTVDRALLDHRLAFKH